ncbi:MAG: hypothetical protein KGH54_02275 [Candidatus Micrarchaeota archaeon]|nr:hypothetical protein [Candidatus Micrarchaeota archaeon]
MDKFRQAQYDLGNPKIVNGLIGGRQIDTDHVYFFGSKAPNIPDKLRKRYLEDEKMFFSALHLGKIADAMENGQNIDGSYYGATIRESGFEHTASLSAQNALYREAGKLLRYLIDGGKTNLNSTMGELGRAVRYCDLGGDDRAAGTWLKLAIKRTNGILDEEDRIISKAGRRS